MKFVMNSYFQKVKQNLSNDKNSIIIFGGRFPLYLSNYYFDNKEGGIEGIEWEINIFHLVNMTLFKFI